MFHRKNLLFIGLLLLVVFAAAVWMVGIGIDRTANRMHSSMIEEVGRYRADLIAMDFEKLIGLSASVEEYVKENPDDDPGLQTLFKGLVKLDAKITRVWYQKGDRGVVCVDSGGVFRPEPVLRTTLENLVRGMIGRSQSKLYHHDGILYWTVFWHSGEFSYGFDVSLPGLHSYFAGMSPAVRSYAYVLNKDGILIVHPDEMRIGRWLANDDDKVHWSEAVRHGKILHQAAFSQYLLLPVERVYYPVNIGKEKWVVVVNVPDLVTQEEMDDFHGYTSMIVVLTVLIFSILLAYSQYKWRKEYDRRRQLEQETLQLNLQQLKNQINPHFLFNSLNSLSALIGSEPALAKEFVLNLSKIYRYVLEKRNESLVPVQEEIAFIRHYYFLQKIRFQEHLQLEIDDSLQHEERMIPLMSLQLLIENAVKHNEITRQHPLFIRIYADGDMLVVENSYQPRKDVSGDSLGIGFDHICQIYAYCSDRKFTWRVEEGRFRCLLPLLRKG